MITILPVTTRGHPRHHPGTCLLPEREGDGQDRGLVVRRSMDSQPDRRSSRRHALGTVVADNPAYAGATVGTHG